MERCGLLAVILLLLPLLCSSLFIPDGRYRRNDRTFDLDLGIRDRRWPQQQTVMTKTLYLPKDMALRDLTYSNVDRYRVCFLSPTQCYLPPSRR
ncbi:unnamed protein product, partial [Mesorhabditis spiculigera]